MRFLRPSIVFVSALFAPALVLSGCASEKHSAKADAKSPGMQLAAGQTPERAEAGKRTASTLAKARCAAIDRCEKSRRPGWALANDEYCSDVMSDEAQEFVDTCGAKGVDAKKAEACAAKWSTFEDCKKVDKPIGSIKECHLDELCSP